MISRNISDLDALGPAIPVALVTGTYGYLLEVVIRILFLSRNAG